MVSQAHVPDFKNLIIGHHKAAQRAALLAPGRPGRKAKVSNEPGPCRGGV